MNESMNPDPTIIIIIAGPNGAGKTASGSTG
jgi:uridine kinase